jgi:hypothetical protein
MLQTGWSWSHSLKNYVLMFDLTSEEFCHPILDVAAGPSSFNVEMKRQGYKVVSSDPLYATSPDMIDIVTNNLINNLSEQIKSNPDRFHWGEEFSNPSELERQQRAMAEIFCHDYERGLKEKRYTADALPNLHFDDFQFSLALCANFIFDGPYANDLIFQMDSIHEMCRVAKEVRIYPLLDRSGQISPHLGPIIAELQMKDYGVEVREVPYQFVRHGNAMLRVFARNCPI